MIRQFLIGFCLLVMPAASAQTYVLAPRNDGQLAAAVIPGTFTVATLPSAAANQARYAFVTDLGGGADMVLSDGTYWKHIRSGVVTVMAGASSLMLQPLVSPPFIQISGSLLSSLALTISTTNLYPGETFRIIIPSGVLAAAGTYGIGVQGLPSLPLLGGTWSDFMWNGTALVKTAGGTL